MHRLMEGERKEEVVGGMSREREGRKGGGMEERTPSDPGHGGSQGRDSCA